MLAISRLLRPKFVCLPAGVLRQPNEEPAAGVDLQPGQRHDQGQLRRSARGDAVLHQLPCRRAAAVQRQCAPASCGPRALCDVPGSSATAAHKYSTGGVSYVHPGTPAAAFELTLDAHGRPGVAFGHLLPPSSEQEVEIGKPQICAPLTTERQLFTCAPQRRSCRSGSCRSSCACPRRTWCACCTRWPAPSTRCARPPVRPKHGLDPG